MHRALAVNHIKGLIGVVAVHVVFVAGLGINMNPGMEFLGVEDHFSLTFFGHLNHVHDFDWHIPSSVPTLTEPYQSTTNLSNSSLSCVARGLDSRTFL